MIQQLGSSSPTSLLNSSADGLSCICMASLSLRSIILSDLSIIATSSHLIGCCNPQTCSAMADLLVSPFLQASLCSLILVSSLRMVSPIYTLARVKDRLPTELSSGVVYQVPCSCGKVYIGETIRRLETRIKEHKDACRKGETNKSAIAEHVWGLQHPIKWDEVAIIDKSDRMIELRLKEAMHIQLRPSAELFNRDVGLELPSCWITTLKAIRHS